MVILASMLGCGVCSANDDAASRRLCNATAVFDEIRLTLWPASIVDMSFHGDGSDAKMTANIQSGHPSGIAKILAMQMKEGGQNARNVVLVAPAVRLRPLLQQIDAELSGEHLPHLTFLLIGARELEGEARRLIEGLDASFMFLPYQDHPCVEKPNPVAPRAAE